MNIFNWSIMPPPMPGFSSFLPPPPPKRFSDVDVDDDAVGAGAKALAEANKAERITLEMNFMVDAG